MMLLQAWLVRRFLTLALAAGLMLVALAACSDGGTAEAQMSDNNRHAFSHGSSLSPDGRIYALAVPNGPANELWLIDLLDQNYKRVVAADGAVLADPAFSSDGTALLMVSSRSPHFNASKIVMLDLERGARSEFGDRHMSYRHPALAPDGKHVAYFRNVDAYRPTTGDIDNDKVYHAYSIFERNLLTGVETRLSSSVFAIPTALYFDTKGRGLFFGAIEPKVPVIVNGITFYQSPDWAAKYLDETGNGQNFLLSPNLRSAPQLLPYAPARGETRGAVVAGVLLDGRILLEVVFNRSEGAKRRRSAALFDGVTLRPVSQETILTPRTSATGDVVVGLRVRGEERDDRRFDLVRCVNEGGCTFVALADLQDNGRVSEGGTK